MAVQEQLERLKRSINNLSLPISPKVLDVGAKKSAAR
jgi:hypothetical protein